jgi:uncharacterized membrane protein
MIFKLNKFHEVGRVLFAVPMIIFGVFHFLNTRSLQNVVPFFIPEDTFWVYLTGVALISAGISILIKKHTTVVCNLLGVMLLVFVVLVHLPIALEGDITGITSIFKETTLALEGVIMSKGST